MKTTPNYNKEVSHGTNTIVISDIKLLKKERTFEINNYFAQKKEEKEIQPPIRLHRTSVTEILDPPSKLQTQLATTIQGFKQYYETIIIVLQVSNNY